MINAARNGEVGINMKKILILTAQTNDPAIFDLQATAVKRNIRINYDFIAGIDIPPKNNEWDIKGNVSLEDFSAVAQSHGINLIKIPEKLHNNRNILFPSGIKSSKVPNFAHRCADTFQFLISTTNWQRYDALLYLDGDMLPISPVDSIPVSSASPLLGVKQTRQFRSRQIEYIWPGLVWMSSEIPFSHLINFDLRNSRILRTDVGGEMAKWLKAANFFGVGYKFMDHFTSCHWTEKDLQAIDGISPSIKNWIRSDYRNIEGNFFCEIYDSKYLHYRGGGNWLKNNPESEIRNRNSLIEAFGHN